MSKQITLTVPDVVHEAMELKGRLFDLSAGEWLKQKVLASAMCAEVTLGLGEAVEVLRCRHVTLPPMESGELPLQVGRDG